MSHAIFKTGGKQYRVAAGERLRIPTIPGEAGQKITFPEVLALEGESTKFGTPLVAGAKVEAEILAQVQGKKLVIFKFKRRKRYQRKNGHRQRYTDVKITAICA
jgi:large subunit ribosomal protein L21